MALVCSAIRAEVSAAFL